MSGQLLGLLTGILFGFILQKGRVLRFEKQIGMMLLEDMTILKFMLSAVITGMIGLHILSDAGYITLSHKSMNIGALAVGGTLFGLGWSVMGFCPGTSVGALGEGRWHALWAIAGMVTGAAIFAEMYPFFTRTVLAWADLGSISITDITGFNHWTAISLLLILIVSLFMFFEKKKI